jgi:DDE superfamily endonuclease
MPAIVEFPTVVQELLVEYGDLFANAPERRHFAEYLTGLFIAERKTVSGINREFAVTTDQSCLNRFLTEVEWKPEPLNKRRLDELQRDSSTRYAKHGVIAIDNTLIDHSGKLIADVGWFWDHADQRHLIAHDYLIANYVCASGKHYPLEFRRFRKKDACLADGTTFKNHTVLCKELVDWVVDQAIEGDFTFDSYFTNAEILNHIASKQRNYVGDLKFNRTITVDGQDWKAIDWVKSNLGPLCRQKTTADGKVQWYFTKSIRIPGVSHTVRIVVLWKEQRDAEPGKILVTNRTYWEVHRILKVYRKRWTIPETFHRDGKQHLGMGACQLRSGEGQTRHMYLVFLAYSALMRQLQHDRAQEWAHARLTTVGESCRAMFRETLGKTIAWVVEQVTQGQSLSQIKAHLALP